jgi:cytochrome c2
MAKLYLEKVMTRNDASRVPDSGFTAEEFERLAADADERELGVGAPSEDRLKMYVGKKGIGNMGCYACHTIPGFQAAKPIGAALNEWGKKDVERLAFEDAESFLKNRFSVVELRDDPKDKSKPHEDWARAVKSGKKSGKDPYEQYFADMLGHHGRTREGFLHLKLAEPRSYDHNRLRTWDERLRMPQFKFARTKRMKDESDEAFEARSAKEEAEGREAVMTFILGLVAENVPAKYVHNPNADKAAEIRGRQVLDKYNCAGCHVIRPGMLEVKQPNLKDLDALANTRKQEVPYAGDDYVLNEHIGWAGLPQSKPDRFTLRTVRPPLAPNPEDDEPTAGKTNVWLLHALQYKNEGKVRNIPAGSALELDSNAILANHAQLGGTYMELLAKYLRRKDKENYGDSKVTYTYTAGPPTLIGEGEKVQPDWLYQFLLNPTPIRPLAVLRMPKFNMSPDEAMALVSYFAAVDKVQNPGIGLTYPYVAIPQRDDSYLEAKTAEYIARLRAGGQYDARKKELQPFFQRQAQSRIDDADRRAKAAAEALTKAPEADKATAQQAKDAADKFLEAVKANALKDMERNWEEREAYLADAGRLVVHGNLCLTCHQAGSEPPKEFKGPNLNITWQRMRPDWTQRWITNPNRFLHYVSVMPINFKGTGPAENQDAFVGSSEQQIAAVRDFLMAYPLVKDWPILRARPVLGMGPPPMPAAPEKK